MKTHEFRLAPIKFYALLIAAVGLTALHLAHTLTGVAAFSAFHTFCQFFPVCKVHGSLHAVRSYFKAPVLRWYSLPDWQ